MAVKSLLKCVGCGAAGRQLANHSIPARGLLSALTQGPSDAALEESCKFCALVSVESLKFSEGKPCQRGNRGEAVFSPKMTF